MNSDSLMLYWLCKKAISWLMDLKVDFMEEGLHNLCSFISKSLFFREGSYVYVTIFEYLCHVEYFCKCDKFLELTMS